MPPVKRVTVQADSIPSGTMVKVNGIRVGQAPVTFQLVVDENGVLRERTTIIGDNSTNVRTPNSISTATLLLEAGQDAPTRIWFTENAGTMTVETSGRAIPPLVPPRRN